MPRTPPPVRRDITPARGVRTIPPVRRSAPRIPPPVPGRSLRVGRKIAPVTLTRSLDFLGTREEQAGTSIFVGARLNVTKLVGPGKLVDTLSPSAILASGPRSGDRAYLDGFAYLVGPREIGHGHSVALAMTRATFESATQAGVDLLEDALGFLQFTHGPLPGLSDKADLPPIPISTAMGIAGVLEMGKAEAFPALALPSAGRFTFWDEAITSLANGADWIDTLIPPRTTPFGRLNIASCPQVILAQSRTVRELAVWRDAAREAVTSARAMLLEQMFD